MRAHGIQDGGQAGAFMRGEIDGEGDEASHSGPPNRNYVDVLVYDLVPAMKFGVAAAVSRPVLYVLADLVLVSRLVSNFLGWLWVKCCVVSAAAHRIRMRKF
jgi:hypothetical protein